MSLDITNYEEKTRRAVKIFWESRAASAKKQKESGKTDQGGRSSVTAGKNMDGFLEIIVEVIKANGLSESNIALKGKVLVLPGYFRATKAWDILVTYKSELIAVVELKSHVGSIGNNQNNRAEETIGSGVDFWKAYRDGAFGDQLKPFVGWLMLVEDCKDSNKVPRVFSKKMKYPIFQDFEQKTYLERYDILCKKMIQEQLYTSASVLASSESAIEDGSYFELSKTTGMLTFLSSLAGYIASAKTRLG